MSKPNSTPTKETQVSIKETQVSIKETQVSIIDRVMAKINKPANEKLKEKITITIEDTILKVKGTLIALEHQKAVQQTKVDRAKVAVKRAQDDLEDHYITFDEYTTPEGYLETLNIKNREVANAENKLAIAESEFTALDDQIAEMQKIQTVLA